MPPLFGMRLGIEMVKSVQSVKKVADLLWNTKKAVEVVTEPLSKSMVGTFMQNMETFSKETKPSNWSFFKSKQDNTKIGHVRKMANSAAAYVEASKIGKNLGGYKVRSNDTSFQQAKKIQKRNANFRFMKNAIDNNLTFRESMSKMLGAQAEYIKLKNELKQGGISEVNKFQEKTNAVSKAKGDADAAMEEFRSLLAGEKRTAISGLSKLAIAEDGTSHFTGSNEQKQIEWCNDFASFYALSSSIESWAGEGQSLGERDVKYKNIVEALYHIMLGGRVFEATAYLNKLGLGDLVQAMASDLYSHSYLSQSLIASLQAYGFNLDDFVLVEDGSASIDTDLNPDKFKFRQGCIDFAKDIENDVKEHNNILLKTRNNIAAGDINRIDNHLFNKKTTDSVIYKLSAEFKKAAKRGLSFNDLSRKVSGIESPEKVLQKNTLNAVKGSVGLKQYKLSEEEVKRCTNVIKLVDEVVAANTEAAKRILEGSFLNELVNNVKKYQNKSDELIRNLSVTLKHSDSIQLLNKIAADVELVSAFMNMYNAGVNNDNDSEKNRVLTQLFDKTGVRFEHDSKLLAFSVFNNLIEQIREIKDKKEGSLSKEESMLKVGFDRLLTVYNSQPLVKNLSNLLEGQKEKLGVAFYNNGQRRQGYGLDSEIETLFKKVSEIFTDEDKKAATELLKGITDAHESLKNPQPTEQSPIKNSLGVAENMDKLLKICKRYEFASSKASIENKNNNIFKLSDLASEIIKSNEDYKVIVSNMEEFNEHLSSILITSFENGHNMVGLFLDEACRNRFVNASETIVKEIQRKYNDNYRKQAECFEVLSQQFNDFLKRKNKGDFSFDLENKVLKEALSELGDKNNIYGEKYSENKQFNVSELLAERNRFAIEKQFSKSWKDDKNESKQELHYLLKGGNDDGVLGGRAKDLFLGMLVQVGVSISDENANEINENTNQLRNIILAADTQINQLTYDIGKTEILMNNVLKESSLLYDGLEQRLQCTNILAVLNKEENLTEQDETFLVAKKWVSQDELNELKQPNKDVEKCNQIREKIQKGVDEYLKNSQPLIDGKDTFDRLSELTKSFDDLKNTFLENSGLAAETEGLSNKLKEELRATLVKRHDSKEEGYDLHNDLIRHHYLQTANYFAEGVKKISTGKDDKHPCWSQIMPTNMFEKIFVDTSNLINVLKVRLEKSGQGLSSEAINELTRVSVLLRAVKNDINELAAGLGNYGQYEFLSASKQIEKQVADSALTEAERACAQELANLLRTKTTFDTDPTKFTQQIDKILEGIDADRIDAVKKCANDYIRVDFAVNVELFLLKIREKYESFKENYDDALRIFDKVSKHVADGSNNSVITLLQDLTQNLAEEVDNVSSFVEVQEKSSKFGELVKQYMEQLNLVGDTLDALAPEFGGPDVEEYRDFKQGIYEQYLSDDSRFNSSGLRNRLLILNSTFPKGDGGGINSKNYHNMVNFLTTSLGVLYSGKNLKDKQNALAEILFELSPGTKNVNSEKIKEIKQKVNNLIGVKQDSSDKLFTGLKNCWKQIFESLAGKTNNNSDLKNEVYKPLFEFFCEKVAKELNDNYNHVKGEVDLLKKLNLDEKFKTFSQLKQRNKFLAALGLGGLKLEIFNKEKAVTETELQGVFVGKIKESFDPSKTIDKDVLTNLEKIINEEPNNLFLVELINIVKAQYNFSDSNIVSQLEKHNELLDSNKKYNDILNKLGIENIQLKDIGMTTQLISEKVGAVPVQSIKGLMEKVQSLDGSEESIVVMQEVLKLITETDLSQMGQPKLLEMAKSFTDKLGKIDKLEGQTLLQELEHNSNGKELQLLTELFQDKLAVIFTESPKTKEELAKWNKNIVSENYEDLASALAKCNPQLSDGLVHSAGERLLQMAHNADNCRKLVEDTELLAIVKHERYTGLREKILEQMKSTNEALYQELSAIKFSSLNYGTYFLNKVKNAASLAEILKVVDDAEYTSNIHEEVQEKLNNKLKQLLVSNLEADKADAKLKADVKYTALISGTQEASLDSLESYRSYLQNRAALDADRKNPDTLLGKLNGLSAFKPNELKPGDKRQLEDYAKIVHDLTGVTSSEQERILLVAELVKANYSDSLQFNNDNQVSVIINGIHYTDSVSEFLRKIGDDNLSKPHYLTGSTEKAYLEINKKDGGIRFMPCYKDLFKEGEINSATPAIHYQAYNIEQDEVIDNWRAARLAHSPEINPGRNLPICNLEEFNVDNACGKDSSDVNNATKCFRQISEKMRDIGKNNPNQLLVLPCRIGETKIDIEFIALDGETGNIKLIVPMGIEESIKTAMGEVEMRDALDVSLLTDVTYSPDLLMILPNDFDLTNNLTLNEVFKKSREDHKHRVPFAVEGKNDNEGMQLGFMTRDGFEKFKAEPVVGGSILDNITSLWGGKEKKANEMADMITNFKKACGHLGFASAFIDAALQHLQFKLARNNYLNGNSEQDKLEQDFESTKKFIDDIFAEVIEGMDSKKKAQLLQAGNISKFNMYLGIIFNSCFEQDSLLEKNVERVQL